MRVSELTGAKLDYWVARAEGFTDERKQDGQMVMGDRRILVGPDASERYRYSPSTQWQDGGPIVERINDLHRLLPADRGWSARIWLDPQKMLVACYGYGPTPLIAAMRAFVASKYGEEVPDEVTP